MSMTLLRDLVRRKAPKPIPKRVRLNPLSEDDILPADRNAAQVLDRYCKAVVEVLASKDTDQVLRETEAFRKGYLAGLAVHGPDWLLGMEGRPPRPRWVLPVCTIVGEFCLQLGYDTPEDALRALNMGHVLP